MQIDVKNRDGRLLAKLELDNNNELRFLDAVDPDFSRFVEEALKNGITRKKDIRNPKGRGHLLVTELVGQTDPLFPLAFKEFLEDNGYDVIKKYPKIEAEIAELLAEYPDDEHKADTLTRLKNMSYLEQTTLLEALRIMKGT